MLKKSSPSSFTNNNNKPKVVVKWPLTKLIKIVTRVRENEILTSDEKVQYEQIVKEYSKKYKGSSGDPAEEDLFHNQVLEDMLLKRLREMRNKRLSNSSEYNELCLEVDRILCVRQSDQYVTLTMDWCDFNLRRRTFYEIFDSRPDPYIFDDSSSDESNDESNQEGQEEADAAVRVFGEFVHNVACKRLVTREQAELLGIIHNILHYDLNRVKCVKKVGEIAKYMKLELEKSIPSNVVATETNQMSFDETSIASMTADTSAEMNKTNHSRDVSQEKQAPLVPKRPLSPTPERETKVEEIRPKRSARSRLSLMPTAPKVVEEIRPKRSVQSRLSLMPAAPKVVEETKPNRSARSRMSLMPMAPKLVEEIRPKRPDRSRLSSLPNEPNMIVLNSSDSQLDSSSDNMIVHKASQKSHPVEKKKIEVPNRLVENGTVEEKKEPMNRMMTRRMSLSTSNSSSSIDRSSELMPPPPPPPPIPLPRHRRHTLCPETTLKNFVASNEPSVTKTTSTSTMKLRENRLSISARMNDYFVDLPASFSANVSRAASTSSSRNESPSRADVQMEKVSHKEAEESVEVDDNNNKISVSNIYIKTKTSTQTCQPVNQVEFIPIPSKIITNWGLKPIGYQIEPGHIFHKYDIGKVFRKLIAKRRFKKFEQKKAKRIQQNHPKKEKIVKQEKQKQKDHKKKLVVKGIIDKKPEKNKNIEPIPARNYQQFKVADLPVPKKSLTLFLEALFSHKHSFILVELKRDDRIKRPMDLNQLRKLINLGEINTIVKFHRSVLLMFTNYSIVFHNKTNKTHQMIREMLDYYMSEIVPMFKTLDDSEADESISNTPLITRRMSIRRSLAASRNYL